MLPEQGTEGPPSLSPAGQSTSWGKFENHSSTRPGDSAHERSEPQEGRKYLMSSGALWQSCTPQAGVPRGNGSSTDS